MSLDVVVGANGGTIEGGSHGRATVIDIPSAERRARWNLYRQVTTDEDGHFSLRGLNPGKHKIFAFEELPGFPDDVLKPNFLSTLRR
jgi:hypothetical protein